MNDYDAECYSKKKKNQNEIYKVIIIAQFIYEGTLINAFGTTTLAVFRFLKESSCMELESLFKS